MIVCKACGSHNEDGAEFCNVCGRYLGWAGEHIEPEPEPEPLEEPQEAPAAAYVPTRPEKVLSALHLRSLQASEERRRAYEHDTAMPTMIMPAQPVAFEEAHPLSAPISLNGDGVETNGAAENADSVEALVAATRSAENGGEESPVSTAAPVEEEVDDDFAPGTAPRKPTDRRKASRPAMFFNPAMREIAVRPTAEDVYCLVCKQFNAPSRVFCRRCGARLPRAATEEDVRAYVPLTFFQRHFRRDRHPVDAGTRPGRWGRASSGGGASGRMMAISTRLGMVVLGAVAVLSFIGPYSTPLRNWYDHLYRSVIHKVDISYSQDFAIGAEATSSVPAHPAGDMADDNKNTYWQSKPSKNNGVGQVVTVIFSSATTIDRLGVLSGAGPTEQAFLGEARPEQILITFSNGSKVTETLQDTSSFQHLDVHAPNITTLSIKVLSVYPSPTGHAVALDEVEFFTRT